MNFSFSYAYTHSPIDFYFKQTPRDFVVEEIPLYTFSGSGSHLIIKLRKKNITTFEMLKAFSSYLGVKENEIGYAGLKDKDSLAIQHISLPSLYEKKLESFFHERIKILETTKHQNKIKIGHLKGNRFFIRVKKLNPLNSVKIFQIISQIKSYGIPNYFGYQRFGKNLDNYLLGESIIKEEKKLRNKKLRDFLIGAYQSLLFNQWLSLRIDISHLLKLDENFKEVLTAYLHTQDIPECFSDKQYCKGIKNQPHFFKLFSGDMMCHYPFGRNFMISNESIYEDSHRFLNKSISVMGLLGGKKMQVTQNLAGFFEKNFVDARIKSIGQRRYAWIFVEDLEFFYKEEEAQGEFSFYLPKGAYATNLLREIAHNEVMQTEWE
ncbi:tRNA pseudouridine(13) synthase TruD [Helicobacter apodemus]|uniref:tRNA pseudouridine synthase D n=1 Tax=Helicobacter apodemus TaxID=135569 RepID=A0A2U8FCE8_9HELI|nr:tRNA pseudouridine(13) synthase TruD [Helicobacter apodemus]AWI33834.1 tRNA pseudouridine(13) synthase TruD [Helicobacter apodemus]